MKYIDWVIQIEPFEILEQMSKDSKKDLINNLKLDDDIFQMFLEYFANEDWLNDLWFYKEIDENRLELIKKIHKTFIENIPQLRIIKDLKALYKQMYSSDRIYWHIYHDAPEHIREYFKEQSFYKSQYSKSFNSVADKFEKRIVDLI